MNDDASREKSSSDASSEMRKKIQKNHPKVVSRHCLLL
nr:MAG TPA: hypothetical protein [Bacteriophage sp.]